MESLEIHSTRCRGYSQVRVKPRRDRGGLEPKSRRGRRKRKRDPMAQHRRSDYAGSHRDTALATQRTRKDDDTGRHKQRIYTYECEQKQIKVLQPAMGHGLDTNEERTGRRTDADLCSLRRREQENRSEVLPDVHGRSSKQREPPRNPATESDGAENREQEQREKLRNRFGSTSSSPREIFSSSSSSSFYSFRRSRSTFNSSPTVSNRLDPRRYLLRPYSLLGTHVREEPVPAPWCSNSSRGRFSSRHRSKRRYDAITPLISDILRKLWESLLVVVCGQYDNMPGSLEVVLKKRRNLLQFTDNPVNMFKA